MQKHVSLLEIHGVNIIEQIFINFKRYLSKKFQYIKGSDVLKLPKKLHNTLDTFLSNRIAFKYFFLLPNIDYFVYVANFLSKI